MSEIAKCPCCGKERERAPHYNKVVAWTCSKCCFTCNNEDLPRIAAAMELAKAEVAASTAACNVPPERLEAAIEASEDMLFQARMKVLSVLEPRALEEKG